MKQTAAPARDDTPAGIIANLPRRQLREVPAGDATLSQMRFVTFEASRWLAFRRLLTGLNLVVSFAVGTALDWLTRRDTPGRRAQRLRHAFERNDAAFIKLGMHL